MRLLDYLIYNKYQTIVVLILLFTILLQSQGISFSIPCLFTLLFDMSCPGCGLTRAFVCLLHLDFIGAWNNNSMIFIIIPASIYFIISDFYNKKNPT